MYKDTWMPGVSVDEEKLAAMLETLRGKPRDYAMTEDMEIAAAPVPEVDRPMLSWEQDDAGEWTAPQWAADVGASLQAPGKALRGEFASDEEAAVQAANLGLNFTGQGVLANTVRGPTPGQVNIGGGGRSTVRNPQRKAFPGIYKRPEELVADVQVEPESAALEQLFGVTRDDLYEISKRPGNQPGVLPGAAAKPKGSEAAGKITKPANTERILNALRYAKEEAPDLYKGMHGWYVMDPAYQRMVEIVGEDEAKRLYSQLNHLTGMSSPGSNVLTELNRGSAANMLAEQDRFSDFLKYGGGTEPGRPADMEAVLGHPYHRTAQAGPMAKYLDAGELQMNSPKVPVYIQSSSVPELGFQTDIPVGDAHWSRATGLADTRTNKGYGGSVSNPEMQQLAPWWRDEVAGELDMESVPAQAVAWGLFGPQTGVDTAVGAPKLELLAQQIMKAADRLGISPEEARDRILTGKEHAGQIDPELAAAVAALSAGGLAAYGSEE